MNPIYSLLFTKDLEAPMKLRVSPPILRRPQRYLPILDLLNKQTISNHSAARSAPLAADAIENPTQLESNFSTKTKSIPPQLCSALMEFPVQALTKRTIALNVKAWDQDKDGTPPVHLSLVYVGIHINNVYSDHLGLCLRFGTQNWNKKTLGRPAKGFHQSLDSLLRDFYSKCKSRIWVVFNPFCKRKRGLLEEEFTFNFWACTARVKMEFLNSRNMNVFARAIEFLCLWLTFIELWRFNFEIQAMGSPC